MKGETYKLACGKAAGGWYHPQPPMVRQEVKETPVTLYFYGCDHVSD